MSPKIPCPEFSCAGTMSPTSPQQKFIDHSDSAAVSRIGDTYADLVRRIDAFLNDAGGHVRRGTQQKVRESLTVINRALNQYGYPPNSELWGFRGRLTGDSMALHCRSTAEKIVSYSCFCTFTSCTITTPPRSQSKPASLPRHTRSPKSTPLSPTVRQRTTSTSSASLSR
jgi:hypothetical protein